MKICKKCGAKLADDALFCDYCGNKLGQEFIFCESCGEKNLSDALFCQKCGHKLTKDQEEVKVESPAQPEPTIELRENLNTKDTKNEKYFGKKSSKRSVKPIIFALIALLFIGGGGFFLFKNFSLQKSPDNFVCYQKNRIVYYSDFSKNAPFTLAKGLNEYTSMGDKLVFSSDGKFVVYGDNFDNDEIYSLYIRSTNFKKDDVEKIDSDVSLFELINNDKDVLYERDQDLYIYNISKSNKEKIDSDINYYRAESNGRLFYLTNDNRLYLKDPGKEKVKLASDVELFSYSEENPDKILFTSSDKDLYEISPGGDKQKVASDVFVFYFNQDGSYYYHTGDYDEDDNKMFYRPFGGESILVARDVDSINTIIYPDGKALAFAKSKDELYSKVIEESGAGKEVKKPTPPKYPYAYEFETDLEYEASYDKYLVEKDVYDQEYEAYRNSINNSNKIQMLSDTVKDYLDEYYFDLYYFDGKEAKKIGTAFNGMTFVGNQYSGVVLSPKENLTEKLKLSSLLNLDESEIYSKIQKEIMDIKYLSKGSLKKIGGNIEMNDIYGTGSGIIGNSDSICYFLTPKGDLYKFDSSASEIVPELYDSDVCGSPYLINDGKDIFYVKDADSRNNGDLYKNKEKLDSDVYAFSIDYLQDSNRLYYGKGNFEKSNSGELYYLENGKIQKVDDNVQSFTELNDKIYYLNDYNLKSMKGDLKVFSGGKSELIDKDVSDIIYPAIYSLYEDEEFGC